MKHRDGRKMGRKELLIERSISNSAKVLDWRWLVLWCAIYAGFLVLELVVSGFMGLVLLKTLKYLGILLCLVYVRVKFPYDALLTLALLFVLLSDTILMWTDWSVAGVYCFCFAQFFHTARLVRSKPKFLIWYFLGLFAVFIFAIWRGVEPIYAISTIYALNLLVNVGLSFLWFRSDRRNPRANFALWGFVLFIACDVCVAAGFLDRADHALPILAPQVVAYLVWVFYYPSQVLLANSSNLEQARLAKKSIKR